MIWVWNAVEVVSISIVLVRRPTNISDLECNGESEENLSQTPRHAYLHLITIYHHICCVDVG